jgi:N-acetylglutamate synthase
MVEWPRLGTRVTVRFRLPAGSVPPLTDAVGHLLSIDPVVRVRTRNDAVIECAPDDVVALRVLTDAPVRTRDIRRLERAAADAAPATEQVWLDGWLLRSGDGPALDTTSAVPLDISSGPDTVAAIVAWYTQRGLPPRLAIPDRLLRPPAGLNSEYTERVMVRPLDCHAGVTPANASHSDVTPAEGSTPAGHAGVSPDNANHSGVTPKEGSTPAGHAGVTPDDASHAGVTLEELGLSCVRIDERDAVAVARAEEQGFRLHHRTRYFRLPPGA